MFASTASRPTGLMETRVALSHVVQAVYGYCTLQAIA